MRAISIMLVIVAIIWALNAYAGTFLDKSSEEMTNAVAQARQAALAGDQEGTQERLSDVRGHWEGMEKRWEVLVDHREIDRIDTLVAHLEGMVKAGTLDTMLPELDELSFFFQHIDEKHKLKMENIF